MVLGYKFEAPQEPPPPTVDDEIRRKEEEELQRVLEMSVQDKGGRSQWAGYSPAAGGSSSSRAGASSSNSHLSANKQSTLAAGSSSLAQNTYHSGYVPHTPSPTSSAPAASQAPATYTNANSPVPSTASGAQTTDSIPVVTRVRALHTFEPTEQGELAFEKGDIIKVVDRGYKDWWRGQLKGRTGIFPVNYVVSPKFNFKSGLF